MNDCVHFSAISRASGIRRRCAVVIPARNEADSLPDLLARLEPQGLGALLVVDNGSTDRTSEIARAAGAEIVFEPRAGYGAACAAGLAALAPEIEVVVFLDADLADDPAQLPAILDPIEAGEADLVIGVRPAALREPGAMTRPQLVGNWLVTGLIWLLWGHSYSDLGPFRAVKREALDRLELRDRRFGWMLEMQVRALEEGFRVKEVEVPYRRRAHGVSKISGTVSGVARAGFSILGTIGRLWCARQLSRPGASGATTRT